jgi:gliding motility-associated protein GldC
MSQSAINIQIELDNNKVAEKIQWEATDAGEQREAKAMILGFWDKHEKNTMRIDLWTKEMTVDEMKYFVHQTLLTLSDSFERATGDNKMAATMRDFCDYYAEKMNFQGPQ